MGATAMGRHGRHKDPSKLAKLNDSPTMSRSVLVNKFHRSAQTLAPTTNYPRLKSFLPQNIASWLGSYLKYVFTKRYDFQAYPAGGQSGVYSIAPAQGADKVTLAVAGDWGTGTLEALTIANLMCNNKPDSAKPDFTIHLGDVYYVGDDQEIDENCLGQPGNGYDGVKWPHGNRGSFALNGNHEMYANGKPYFKKFLASLGMTGDPNGQIASFFSLETDQWRVLGIDTGYNSIGVPVLSQIPGINAIPIIGGDCHLESKLLDWLRTVVKPQQNRKATLLLSHHQYFTAFSDHDYTKPAKQLVEFFKDQEVVWIWGHEHRIAIYDKFSKDGGITAYGRCLGHGGMPVEITEPNLQKAPLRYYDQRSHQLDDGTPVGQNGYLNVTIQGGTMTLEYRDIDDKQLLVETFTAGAGGSLQYAVNDQAGILKKV
ncbi:MAG TPA: metallophosphoesterase [Bryobacteraceae bacterium]|nr:metallophosphoesterase [Bryobacteraceae bacterium]